MRFGRFANKSPTGYLNGNLPSVFFNVSVSSFAVRLSHRCLPLSIVYSHLENHANVQFWRMHTNLQTASIYLFHIYYTVQHFYEAGSVLFVIQSYWEVFKAAAKWLLVIKPLMLQHRCYVRDINSSFREALLSSAVDSFVTSIPAHRKVGCVTGRYFLVISEIHGHIQ